MNTAFFQTNIQPKQLPRIKESEVTSVGTTIDFHGGKDAYYQVKIGQSPVISGEMHDLAKYLVEHMDIVEDSRKQINEGNIFTWDGFKKAQKKLGK